MLSSSFIKSKNQIQIQVLGNLTPRNSEFTLHNLSYKQIQKEQCLLDLTNQRLKGNIITACKIIPGYVSAREGKELQLKGTHANEKKINLICPMATLEQKSERSFQQSGEKGLEQLPKKEEGNKRVNGLIDPSCLYMFVV